MRPKPAYDGLQLRNSDSIRLPDLRRDLLRPARRAQRRVAVLQCERCRMGVVAERPLDTAVYYSDDYYSSGEESESGYSEYSMVATHSLAWASELVRLLRPGGKVLDVGCADGHLLQRLGQPYELYGIEVNERLREHCRRAGIRMLGSDICDERLLAGYSGAFEVITAIAVLEHVTDIRTALDHIRTLLAPEGVLIFEVPLISPTQDNRVWFNSSLEHVYYPTPEGLACLFEAVFKLPLIGREVVIRDYGSTFVGVATRLRGEASGAGGLPAVPDGFAGFRPRIPPGTLVPFLLRPCPRRGLHGRERGPARRARPGQGDAGAPPPPGDALGPRSVTQCHQRRRDARSARRARGAPRRRAARGRGARRSPARNAGSARRAKDPQ